MCPCVCVEVSLLSFISRSLSFFFSLSLILFSHPFTKKKISLNRGEGRRRRQNFCEFVENPMKFISPKSQLTPSNQSKINQSIHCSLTVNQMKFWKFFFFCNPLFSLSHSHTGWHSVWLGYKAWESGFEVDHRCFPKKNFLPTICSSNWIIYSYIPCIIEV